MATRPHDRMPGKPITPDMPEPADTDFHQGFPENPADDEISAHPSSEEYEHLLEDFSHLAPATEGEIEALHLGRRDGGAGATVPLGWIARWAMRSAHAQGVALSKYGIRHG